MKQVKIFSLYSIFLLLFASIGSLYAAENSFNILKISDVLITENSLTKEAALKNLHQSKRDSINTAMSTKEIWIRFDTDKIKANNQEGIVVYVTSPIIERVVVYTKQDRGSYKPYKKYGYLQRDDKSPFVHFEVNIAQKKRDFSAYRTALYANRFLDKSSLFKRV